MWRSLQRERPDDYVIGTGQARTVRELCEVAFRAVGLDYRDHVVRDERFVRPPDPCLLVADSTKARSELGWTPLVPFERMVEMMVAADLERHDEGIT
jgi:GDPmannose 4,6-dehydratase